MVICKITEGQNDLTNSGLARLQPSGKQTQRTCAKCRHKAPAAIQEFGSQYKRDHHVVL